MKQITVDDFEFHFYSIMRQVMKGDEVQLLCGSSQIPVACLSPVTEKKNRRRPLGVYNHLGPYWEDETFEPTPEWLFDDINDLQI